MGHVKTLLFKITANGLPVFLILYLAGEVAWTTALMLTLLLIGIAYIVGDMLVLPKVGNLIATMADIALVAVLLWGSRMFGITLDSRAILYTAVAVALAEGLFYHPYLKRLVSMDSMGPRFGNRN